MLAPLLAAALHHNGVPHLVATRVDDPPKLDGRLDDAAWKSARRSSAFTQKFPREGTAPSEPTTIAVVYDDEAVYVGFWCTQKTVPVVTRLTRRDRQVEADYVSIDLDTRSDGKSAFEFTVNASGVLVDATRANDVEVSTDWDENWDARTQVTDEGWTVEMRIPLRILRYAQAPVQSWGFQARRYTSARQETDEFAYIPRAVAGEVSRYGRLDDLRGLQSHSPLELRPFVLGRLRGRTGSPIATASGNDLYASGGADLKWHVSQDLTLDATVNPDFATVEADTVVLNLSTYEVYRPEKRPFFLEGSDILAPRLPHQLVYTRRIGHVPTPQGADNPPLPGLRPNETLVDLPEPSTLYGAYKLTGRLGDDWTIGTLSAATAPNRVGVQAPNGGPITPRLIEPATGYNVVRLKRELGTGAYLGIIGTATTRMDSTGEYPDAVSAGGAPGTRFCPDYSIVAAGARCYHDAYTGGVDYKLRDGDFALAGELFGTGIHSGPPRTLLDGTVVSSGDTGGGGEVYMGKEGGKHVVGGMWFGGVTRKADFNDLGFMFRQNVRYAGAWYEYRTLEPWWETLETHTNGFVENIDNLSGLNIQRQTRLGTQWKLKSFWQLGLDVFLRATHFDDREVGDGTALERAGGAGAKASFQSDPRGRVVGGASAQYFAIFDGYLINADGLLTLRVLPQFDIDLIPQFQTTAGEPRFMGYGQQPGEDLFGKLSATNVSGTLRATYTFAPRLTLQSYAQLFLARGHYTDYTVYRVNKTGLAQPVVRLADLVPTNETLPFSPDLQQGALNVNVILRWEFQLGSTIAVAYVRQQYPTVALGPTDIGQLQIRSIGRAQATDQVFVKVVYWWG